MITIDKDNFTGLKKINSSFYGLTKFMRFDGPSEIYLKYMRDKTGISDAFDLFYIETENGQGNMVIRVCSSVAKFSGNKDWPHWDDTWPMIIDGERFALKSSTLNSFESNYELKLYDLPIDIFSKLCTGKEIQFSLRGRNNKIEGIFLEQHQVLFKAFEQYVFGDESEGAKLLESIGSFTNSKADGNIISKDNENWTCFNCRSQNSVPNHWDTFDCHNCGKTNTITRPKNLTEEDRKTFETKTIDLIKKIKIDDAIKYYALNFGFSEDNAKSKVKELADKNGYSSKFKWFYNKKASIYLTIGVLILVISILLQELRATVETFIPNIGISAPEGSDEYFSQVSNRYDTLKRVEKSILWDFLSIIGLLTIAINAFRLIKKK